MWGLQEEYARKERTNHVHHCIDACIGRREYDRWAQYVADEERYGYGESGKPRFEKPWPTFTEDVKAAADELLVAHHTPDNMAKQTRKKLRVRGRIKLNADGEPIYQQGDTARCRLHQDTFYGAIKQDGEIRYVIRKSLAQLQPTDIDKIIDDAVRDRVREAIDEVGFKTAMNPDEYTIWMNREKGIPIRKVRIFVRKTTLIPLGNKQHRDRSDKEYKRKYLVANEGNYCMAVYEGKDKKGRTDHSFEIISNLQAAEYFKRSTDRNERHDLAPVADTNGYPLKYLLKTGTMVLFYENTPAELYECTRKELVKRLYKVTAMAAEGRVQFLFHQEARDQKTLTSLYGAGTSQFCQSNPSPKLRLSVSNFNMLVEGYDFELTVTGEIKFKDDRPC
jgi:CRISPR-associated endonuclease Csn1